MEPIGASSTWRWYGYENSWVDIDGQKVQSVSGGGHWGGGMFINAYDMARFGYLFLRNGKWKDRTIVSEKWIEMARTPGPRQQDLRLRELVPEHRPQAAAGGAGDRRPLRRQRLEHHLHRLGQRHRRGVPLDQERRGTERRDRQDDVVDAGEDHRGPVRPRFRITSAPLILPAERASLAPGRFCRRLPCHCRPRRRNNDLESIDKKSERDLVCALIFFCHLLSAYTTESELSSCASASLKLFFSSNRIDFRFRGLSSASILSNFISSNPN